MYLGYTEMRDAEQTAAYLFDYYNNCGAIYTQLSDVEDELNGLLTYDRAVCKVDPARMREIGKLLQD